MYYDKQNWVNVTALASIALEKFLTDSLFKSDLTRAVYASSDYAFRRRFELLDTSRSFEEVNASSLQFPFLSYHPEESWVPVPSKRIYSLEEFGETSSSQMSNLRLMQVENNIEVLLYYDREDDARYAQNKIAFISSQKRWDSASVSYAYDTLNLPFSFSIDAAKVSFSPKIQEKEWLSKNRIFILSFKVNVQSMLFFPLESDLPEPFSITERVMMDFSAGKPSSITTVEDVVVDNSIVLNSFTLKRATKTTAKIEWDFVNQGDFDSLALKVNGKTYDLESTDHIKIVRGLIPGAEYTADLYAFKAEYSKHLTLRFSTITDVSKTSDIIGTTW